MNQEFLLKVNSYGNSRELLKGLLESLDTEKRVVRASLRRFSNESYGEGGLAGKERFRKIRRMKSKISHLIEEREFVRNKLGELKSDRKSLNRYGNNSRAGFAAAFVRAAEKVLAEDVFLELEIEANRLLDGGC